MNKPWAPEHPVDEALARELIAAQFPSLEGALTPLGSGWDCDVWLLGATVFRFPRRALAVRLIRSEIAVLPRLAPMLPVSIPTPRFVGSPTDSFPHPFYGHPLVVGTTADRAQLDDAARLGLAPQLGAFLRTLHSVDAAQFDAPRDHFRSDVATIADRARSRLELVPEDLRGALGDALEAVPVSGPSQAVLLHGDLYSRHLVLDGGRLVGVIDWGDVCVGDPAVDLRLAHAFLPPSAHAAFCGAYGPIEPATWARARFLALASYGVSLLAYALDVGDEPLRREALLAIGWMTRSCFATDRGTLQL